MAGLPHITTPMAATQVPRPFHHPGWVYEEKVDGWRVVAYKNAAGVRLITRNGRDLTRRFPELAAAVAGLDPPTLLLDGEIAVFDRQLVSRFEWAQVLARGYEGLIGKDQASAYVEGGPLAWRRITVRTRGVGAEDLEFQATGPRRAGRLR